MSDEKETKDVVEEAIEKNFLTPRVIQVSYYPESGKLSIDQVDNSVINIMEIFGILRSATGYLKSQILFEDPVEVTDEQE